MSTVWIPQVLRAQAGGNKQLELGGSTVGELVGALAEQYPSLRGQLLADGGELNRFVNVYVNGQDVRYLDGLVDGGRRSRRGADPAGDGRRVTMALPKSARRSAGAEAGRDGRRARRAMAALHALRTSSARRTAVATTTSSTRSGTRPLVEIPGCRRTRPSGSSPSSRWPTRRARSRTASRST